MIFFKKKFGKKIKKFSGLLLLSKKKILIFILLSDCLLIVVVTVVALLLRDTELNLWIVLFLSNLRVISQVGVCIIWGCCLCFFYRLNIPTLRSYAKVKGEKSCEKRNESSLIFVPILPVYLIIYYCNLLISFSFTFTYK